MLKTKTETLDEVIARWKVAVEARVVRISRFRERVEREPVLQERLERYRAAIPKGAYPARLLGEEPTIESVAALPEHRLVSVKASDVLEVAWVTIIVRAAGKTLVQGEASKLGDEHALALPLARKPGRHAGENRSDRAQPFRQ